MRSRLLALSLTACAIVLTSPAASQPRRGVPARLRDALVGCWSLDGGETYAIARSGETGLRARWTVPGRSGATEHHEEALLYVPERDAVLGGCGPRTQHGQHCEFRVVGEGSDARVYQARSATPDAPLTRCPAGTPLPPAMHAVPHPVPADATARQLLGARRRDIEATLTPTAHESGWTRYGDDLAISFEAAVAMRVRVRLRVTTCEDAARAAGFTPGEGSSPLRRADACEWPGISARHRLAAHVAARFADGVMEIWLTE